MRRSAPGVVDREDAAFNFVAARQGSSAVEQGTHKPLVGSSILPPGTLEDFQFAIANCRFDSALDVGLSIVER